MSAFDQRAADDAVFGRVVLVGGSSESRAFRLMAELDEREVLRPISVHALMGLSGGLAVRVGGGEHLDVERFVALLRVQRFTVLDHRGVGTGAVTAARAHARRFRDERAGVLALDLDGGR